MLHKKGAERSDIKGYRPISITSVVARLYERVVLAGVKEFLSMKKIIINAQSGFRNQRQTKDNLVFMTQKVQQAFKEGKKALTIFFDIQSAFEKVWHNGLLYKLAKIRLLHYLIISSFLNDPKFYVKVNGAISSIRIIECGVPQGAVLSPALFSIYINDLAIRLINDPRMIIQEFSEFLLTTSLIW